jgi:phosphatidylglycerol:prolipoprotein diacylglycerol transferase
MKPFNLFLDRVIIKANNVYIGKIKIIPYIFFFYMGGILMAVAGTAFIEFQSEHRGHLYFLAIALSGLLYEVLFTRIKARLFNVLTRSYLQDIVVFIIPTCSLFFYVVSIPLPLGLDTLGLTLPLFLCSTRIGCFLSGCCYGIAAKNGVFYPESMMKPHKGLLQNYTPGKKVTTRVLPIQLYEAALQGMTFLLLIFVLSQSQSRGHILPIYLISYSVMRYFLDFFRKESNRPRINGHSEAQVFSLILMAINLLILFML